jgi:hypothetical protein
MPRQSAKGRIIMKTAHLALQESVSWAVYLLRKCDHMINGHVTER